jgi:membrane protein YqaA with SNARE-associated domain
MAAIIAKTIGNPGVPGLAAMILAAPHHRNPFLHFLLRFGVVGIFLVSIVDSSFIPLPVPGVTDIMVLVLAAQHTNVFLLVGLATVGSGLGGLFSHKVGQAGGVAFLEKHINRKIFRRVCDWMNHHAILSVALPAALPPPMPLSPFVLAAGALEMSRRKFMITFTVSRCLRHIAAAAIGIYFGPHVLRVWNMFSRKWGAPILIVLWSVILISVGIAFWRLYKTSKEMRGSKATGTRSPQPASASQG